MPTTTVGQAEHMRLPASRQQLDDRVLGNRLKPKAPGATADDPQDGDVETRGATGDRPVREPREKPAPPDREPRDGPAAVGRVLATVYRVPRLVFLLLALIMVLAIILSLAPSNPDNVIVRNALELAEAAAGPFKDGFTQRYPEPQMIMNYAMAAVVYVLAATLVRTLPTGRT